MMDVFLAKYSLIHGGNVRFVRMSRDYSRDKEEYFKNKK